MRPLRIGVGCLVVAAVSYEPVRQLAAGLGDAVGGVGGVGGLCNLWSPTDQCTTTAGGPEAPYCFHRGVFLGFTPFALAVLAAWTLPLTLAAAAASLTTEHTTSLEPPTELASIRERWAVHGTWATVSMGWFVLPLLQYEADAFYQQDIWHRLLGCSIAAAFPLSWHLSLVAIPSSGAKFLAPVVGVSEAACWSLHKAVGAQTAAWGAVHGGLQLVYLASQHSLGASLGLRRGEDLLYVSGATSLSLLLLVGLLAAIRRVPAVAPRFRAWHRGLAAALVVTAATHWWPFALFLLPAVSVAAVSASTDLLPTPTAAEGTTVAWHPASGATRRYVSNMSSENTPLKMAGVRARALGAALPAGCVGLCVIWMARQAVMGRSNADTWSAFVFPPLSIICSYVCARLAAAVVVRQFYSSHRRRSLEDDPLQQTLLATPVGFGRSTSLSD